jgi:hypothetical protein
MLRRRANFAGAGLHRREDRVIGNVYKAKYLYDFTGKNFDALTNWTAKLAVRKLSQTA